jgi:hypothetical protein
VEQLKPRPKTLRALLARQEWPVAEALYEEVEVDAVGRPKAGEYDRVQEWLDREGINQSVGYLKDAWHTANIYRTAHSRRHKVGFRWYQLTTQHKGTPEQRDQWLAKAAAEKLTLRAFYTLITGGKTWSPETAQVRAAKAIKANPEALAQALIEEPSVARAVVNNPKAHIEVIKAASEKARAKSGSNGGKIGGSTKAEPPEAFARLLMLLNLHAVDKETATMEKLVLEKFTGQFVWRPGQREEVMALLETCQGRIINVMSIIGFEVPVNL